MTTFGRRRFFAASGAALAIGMWAGTPSSGAERAAADAANSGLSDWEQLGVGGRVQRLFAPASGALFALSGGTLHRSDDAGATWRTVTLPSTNAATGRYVLVHPLDHRTVYATGEAGLYRSDDDAERWSLILPGPRRVIAVAVSPADPALIYAALTDTPTDFWLLRSRDGGATWDTLDEQHNSLCGWGVPILAAHPTQPRRVVRTAGCYAGRDTGDDLEQSVDAGATWTRLLQTPTAFPTQLVVGAGAGAPRWYLAANRDGRAGGSSVFTSDDDGGGWTEVLQFRGGGTIERGPANVRIGGIAASEALPERVFVALNRSMGPEPDKALLGSGLHVSDDAGKTWAELGGQDLPEIADLALGIDGAWIFAATADRVWRRRLR